MKGKKIWNRWWFSSLEILPSIGFQYTIYIFLFTVTSLLSLCFSVSFHDFSSHPWPYNTQVLQGTVCWSLPFLSILTPLIILPHLEALITLHIWQFPNLSSLYDTHISHCLLSIFISIHNSKLCKSNSLFHSQHLLRFSWFSFISVDQISIVLLC